MSERARKLLADDVWLSIPAYLHKSIELSFTIAIEQTEREIEEYLRTYDGDTFADAIASGAHRREG